MPSDALSAIQGAPLAAVQRQSGALARTTTRRSPPDAAKDSTDDESSKPQVVPCCEIDRCWSLTRSPPLRGADVWFRSTVNSTTPSPCPLVPRSLTQATSLTADHTHSRAVVI